MRNRRENIYGRKVGQQNSISRPRSAFYRRIFDSEPIERIAMAREGMLASLVKRLLADLAIPQAVALAALNLPAATANRNVPRDECLARNEGDRVIGLARFIGQLEAMIEESGDPAGFDAVGWLSHWLTGPLPAFGGARPLDFLETLEGQALVSRKLVQMQSGAYA